METILALPERNEKALTAVDKANAITIITAHDYGMADEFCMNLKHLEKEVDAAFDEHIEAAYLAHKSLVAKKKTYAAPIDEARRIIKIKLMAWRQNENDKRHAEEARLREEARKKAEEEQIRAAEEAEKNGNKEEAEAIISAPVEALPVVLATSVPKSKTSIRMVKRFRIKNEAAIKRDYLIPDSVKIGGVVRALGKAAEAVVGGIEVFEEAC